MTSLITNGVTKTSTTSAGNDAIRPKAGDTVYCHYIGTLKSSGQQFDSSRDKRRAFTFQVGIGQVIQGWDIAMLDHLSLGERSIFDIESDKAYGPRGAGGVIPPDADLIFDIELLAVNDKVASNFTLPENESSGCVLL